MSEPITQQVKDLTALLVTEAWDVVRGMASAEQLAEIDALSSEHRQIFEGGIYAGIGVTTRYFEALREQQQ